MPLTDEELNELSAELAFARSDRCIIERSVETRSATGAVITTWVSENPVGCRIEPMNRVMNEIVQGGQLLPSIQLWIYFERGILVSPDDRIYVNGQRLEVAAVPGLETYDAELRVAAIASSDLAQ